MKQLSFDNIKAMAIAKDYRPLALHWQSTDKVEKTIACNILFDISTGKYTIEQFEKIGYCVLWSDYEQEVRGLL